MQQVRPGAQDHREDARLAWNWKAEAETWAGLALAERSGEIEEALEKLTYICTAVRGCSQQTMQWPVSDLRQFHPRVHTPKASMAFMRQARSLFQYSVVWSSSRGSTSGSHMKKDLETPRSPYSNCGKTWNSWPPGWAGGPQFGVHKSIHTKLLLACSHQWSGVHHDQEL